MRMQPRMKAMILAAGRGERLRPLTDTCPKPLLRVHGKPLVEWHVEALARAGVIDIVINTAWLEAMLVEALGDGSRFGVRISYSMEGRDHGGALETAGGIAKALPLLADANGGGDDDPFWLVSADIYAPDFAFDPTTAARFEAGSDVAHVWLVPNPDFHAKGDFGLDAQGRGLEVAGADGRTWTYANVALLRPALVRHIAPGTRAALGPLLYSAMRERRIGAQVYGGEWHNLGTPAQLDALNRSRSP